MGILTTSILIFGQKLHKIFSCKSPVEEMPHNFYQYGSRIQTKSDHATIIEQYLGFKRSNLQEQTKLTLWLLPKAMEHDRPTLLLRFILAKLKSDRITRPTLYTLERLVGAVRERVKTYIK